MQKAELIFHQTPSEIYYLSIYTPPIHLLRMQNNKGCFVSNKATLIHDQSVYISKREYLPNLSTSAPIKAQTIDH